MNVPPTPGMPAIVTVTTARELRGGPTPWASSPGRQTCVSSPVKSKAIPASPTVAGRSLVSSVRIAARPYSPEPRSIPILSSSKQAVWMNRSRSSPTAKYGQNGPFPGPTLMRSCRAFRKAVRLDQVVPKTEDLIEFVGRPIPTEARLRSCDTRRRKGELTGNTNFGLHHRATSRLYTVRLQICKAAAKEAQPSQRSPVCNPN